MPADDYTAAVSGGLKLKNVNPSSKVSKSHKKKRPKPSQPDSSADGNAEGRKDAATNDGEDVKAEHDEATVEVESGRVLDDDDDNDGEAASPPPPRAGKTEAELRHEERRRKRACHLSPRFCFCPATMIRGRGRLADNDAFSSTSA